MESLNQLLKEKNAFENYQNVCFRRLFLESLKELFAKHPNLDKVRLIGYVPAYNDGDPCCFGLNEAEFKLKSNELIEEDDSDEDDSEEDDSDEYEDDSDDEDEDDDDDSDWEDSFWYSDNLDPLKPIRDDINEWSDLMQSMEDLVESAFGSWIKLTIDSDGTFTNEEYDCGY